MFKRWIFLLISATILVALYGCHAGGSAPFINVPSESNLVSFEREVGENGRFADIEFPSGAVIRCTQDGTLKKGTKITATEQKVANEANSDDGISSYIYSITGKLYTDEALKTAISVNTLEKPISVTLPNNSTTGTCYIGTRASENDQWRYSLATDGLADIRFARLQASTPSQCNFNLYRLGINFALFVLNNQTKEEAEVDSVEITPTDNVEYKDGKYVADLDVKVKVSGEKLDGIKTDNLKARIVYRSDSLTPEQLKANGSIVKQTDSDDKAVSGTYEHSFEISNIKIESQMSGEAVVSFVLNLDGVSLQAFPTTFLVEFYSDGKAENTLPFTYIQAFSFETKEQQNEPLVTYSITYDLDGGEPTSDNPTSYTIESEITLSNPTKDGYTFLGWTGSNGNTPEETVTIAKGSTGDKSYKANWQQNAPNEYTLTLVAGTGIATVDENKAYKANESITLNCTVKDGYEFDKWSDSEGNAVTSPFTMPAKDMTLTANAKPITYTITLDPNGGTVEYTTKEYNVETADFTLPKVTKDYYTFDGWVLNDGEPVETVTITKGTHENRTYKAKFTPTTYKITLDPNGGTVEYTTKEYNIETADFTLPTPSKEDFEFIGWTWDGQTTPQISVTIKKGSAFNRTYTANWEADAIASLKSDATDFLINGKIEVQFDKDIAWQDSFKDNITITHTTTTTPITINTYSYSNKVLTLTPASNLKYNTEYQIAIAGMEKVSDKNLAFTTLALEVTPLISSQTSDITQVNGVDRLVLQPTFTIDFGKKVLDTTAAKSSIELNDTALPDSCSLVFDESGKIATLTFTADLSVFTDYTLSIKGFSDSDNASIKAESLSFKTIPPENITGEGTQSSPYLIYTQSHLDKLRENQYIGTSGKKYFKQMDDIILTSNWNPIIADDGFNGFTGYYDGNNKKIASLTIANVTIFQDVGLFAYIYDSRIENLTIEDVDIQFPGGCVGALAGGVGDKSVVRNVHVRGKINISGEAGVDGGLIGLCQNNSDTANSIQIINCSVSTTDTNSLVTGEYCIGGLIGKALDITNSNPVEISGCFSKINIQGQYSIGGFIGYASHANISNCYSESKVTLVSESINPGYVGGFASSLDSGGTISNCYSVGTIEILTNEAECVGCFVGSNCCSNINNSFTNVSINVPTTYTENPTGNVYNKGSVPLYYYDDDNATEKYVYQNDDLNKDGTRIKNYLSDGYLNALGWDNTIWNFSAGSLPTLKWEE